MSGKVFKEKQEEKVRITARCEKCHKEITSDSKAGSFTTFLFAANRCSCDKPVHLKVVNPSGGAAQNAVSTANDSKSHNVIVDDKPDLGERYEVLDLIGQGGMGAVWKVRDTAINKTLAIKVLRKELANDRFAIKRFEQEAQAASCLTQANLVAVYGSGMAKDNSPYLIMDYLEGESLADLLQREVYLPVPQVLDISAQICEALAHAHAKGIIHRDLKPSNIMLTKSADGNDIVKIVDFGIAKLMPSINEQTNNLTQTGDLFGSPLYMSPEQCKGETVDARSDIYSLGCIMYEMLTGKAAFAADNPIKIILKHLNDVPAIVTVSGLSESMTSVIERCLEKEPGLRYQNIGDVQIALLPESERLPFIRTMNGKRLFAHVIDSALLTVFALIILLGPIVSVDLVTNSTTFVQRLLPGDLVLILPLFAFGAFLYFVLDTTCIVAVVFVISVILPAMSLAVDTYMNQITHPVNSDVIASNLLLGLIISMLPILMSIVSLLYFTSQQGTLGKRFAKLKVVNATGKPLTVLQALIRHFSRVLIPFQLIFLFLISIFAKFGCNIPTRKDDSILKAPLIHDYLSKSQVRRR